MHWRPLATPAYPQRRFGIFYLKHHGLPGADIQIIPIRLRFSYPGSLRFMRYPSLTVPVAQLECQRIPSVLARGMKNSLVSVRNVGKNDMKMRARTRS